MKVKDNNAELSNEVFQHISFFKHRH